ncbi:hypothetical protein HDU86_004948 [Geranomyces michiganensis]|nr:hypothetical protein HDU86_004948 [Geranomyces michiganensis]
MGLRFPTRWKQGSPNPMNGLSHAAPASVASSIATAIHTPAPFYVEVKEDTIVVPRYGHAGRAFYRAGRSIALLALMAGFLYFTLSRQVENSSVPRGQPPLANVGHDVAQAVADLRAESSAIQDQHQRDAALNQQDFVHFQKELHDLQQTIRDIQQEHKELRDLPQQANVAPELTQMVLKLKAESSAIQAKQQRDALTHQQDVEFLQNGLKDLQHKLQELYQEHKSLRGMPWQANAAAEELARAVSEARAESSAIHDQHQRDVASRQRELEVLQRDVKALQQELKTIHGLPPLANFAISSGARIIDALTSRTFRIPISKFFSWTTNGNPPATALESDLGYGQCWPMAGTSGQLAITLIKPIIPSSVTISHPAEATWTGVEGQSAMREFEVWAVYNKSRFEHINFDKPYYTSSSSSFDKRHPPPPPPAGIKLLSGTFNPAESVVERYPVENDEAVQHVYDVYGAAVSAVVFRIKNNHGNRDWTCVYNVQVHGTPA